jgi:hypothetical protein
VLVVLEVVVVGGDVVVVGADVVVLVFVVVPVMVVVAGEPPLEGVGPAWTVARATQRLENASPHVSAYTPGLTLAAAPKLLEDSSWPVALTLPQRRTEPAMKVGSSLMGSIAWLRSCGSPTEPTGTCIAA